MLYKFLYQINSFINSILPFFSASSLNSPHILFLTPFGIKYDGRVMKSVNALLSERHTVEIIKPKDLIDDEISSWHPNLIITPLGLSGSYSHFPYIYDWKVANYIRQSPANLVICRDIFTGVMGIRAGHASGKKVCVDFYEWYSESKDYNYLNKITYNKPFWKKTLFRYYERYICRHADQLITNNLSFARGISQGSATQAFKIIRNMPDVEAPQPQNAFDLRNSIPKHLHKHILLYYVGQLSFDRKLDTLIYGMNNLPGCVLIIQGSGHDLMSEFFKDILKKFNLEDRILFLPPIHHGDIINYAQSADIGVFICDTHDNKMFHALPNKLFEYVWAGIPQVSSHGPEIDPIFQAHNIGQLFEAYDPQSFANAVTVLLNSENYQKQKTNTEIYREILVHQNDWKNFPHMKCPPIV